MGGGIMRKEVWEEEKEIWEKEEIREKEREEV